MELFQACRECGQETKATIVKVNGSLVKIKQECKLGFSPCGTVFTWNSQPYIHQLPEGNLVISAAILLAGALPSQSLKVFRFMNMAAISRGTYHRHQKNYIVPGIIQEWRENQTVVVELAKHIDGGAVISGDARYDSPGYSAKYGGYTMIENTLNKVIDVQLVQVFHYPLYCVLR